MPKRRSTLPPVAAFGSVLRVLRDDRRLSTGQVEKALKAAGAKLGRSTVTQYEKGAVWSPDPVVLSEMARLYRSDVVGLIAVLKANRQDSSMTTEQADAIRKGAADAGTLAAGVLQDERDEARVAIREMQELATRMVTVAATFSAGEESRLARTREPGRRQGHRTPRR